MSRTNDRIGQFGEQFVGQWLQQQGWVLLHQRWRCRWGEIDIIAQQSVPTPLLILVEVKVRSEGNWDSDGLLSITVKKQKKLLMATQLFLSKFPELDNLPCRFDVALVKHTKKSCGSTSAGPQDESLTTLQFQQRKMSTLNVMEEANSQSPFLTVGEHQFRLQHYIEGAFDAEYWG
ncbi:MAG: YraN family protein [Symploca sp. SIO2B6]|nr:YraN family protein [Symploca sp. SIO2B6]